MENAKEIHNNYDTVFKEALTLYKNKSLDFLGLDLAMIEVPLNTEMTEIKVNKSFADICFLLKDKTGLHIEWEADISVDDMLRFCSYNLNYLRTHKIAFTTVIFTNKKQRITRFENNMLRFSPVVINLSERDGDSLLQKLKDQMINNEPINQLELIYLPLYHSEYKNVAEMLEQVIELAPFVSQSKEESEKIMIMSAVLVNKFIDEEHSKKIWEAIRMYIEDLFIVKYAKEDGRKEGRIEGRVEGKTELIISMLENGLDVETITEITKLPIDELERIIENSKSIHL